MPNKIDKLYSILLVTVAFILGSAIYADDTTLPLHSIAPMLKLVAYACVAMVLMLFLFVSFKRKVIRSSGFVYACLSILSYFVINTIHIYGDTHINFSFAAIVLLLLFVLASRIQQRLSYIYFKKGLVIIGIISLLCYFSAIFHIGLPYSIEPYYAPYPGVEYLDFKISVICREYFLLRSCGVFNEPGFFGTILALVLCAENLNLRNRDNLILFISGIFTFSLAFFVIICMAFFMRMKNKKKLIIPSLFFLCFLLYIQSLNFNSLPDTTINHFLSRLQYVEGIGFAGDNRTSYGLEKVLENFWNANDFWWGFGKGYSVEKAGGSLSFLTYVIDFGIIGCSIFWGTLFISALIATRKNKRALVFLLCFVFSVYQRPHIFNLHYFIVLFGGIQYCLDNSQLKLEE